MKREYPDRPIVAVGAAVCRDNCVLIVKRGKAPNKGMWTVPGGAVHLGETMPEAAAREVREECSIEIAVGQVVGTLDTIIRDEQENIQYHYAIVDLAARYVGGTLCPSDELMGAVWITPAEFDTYCVPLKSRQVLLRALDLYQ